MVAGVQLGGRHAISASLPPSVPDKELERARREARSCERCGLYRNATQTVFGDGPPHVKLMFVGEQPGDREDLAGHPFVGPAGRLFRSMLEETGIAESECYITNAVKHFKFEPRGKFRLHKRPNASEIEACRWWLDIETRLVAPALIVALGATAAQALLGSGKDILRRRGKIETAENGALVFVTVHPSSLLRIGNPVDAAAARSEFERDLIRIRKKNRNWICKLSACNSAILRARAIPPCSAREWHPRHPPSSE